MVKWKGVVVTGPGFTAIKTNSKAETAPLAKGAVEASDRRPDPMPVDDPIDHSVDETDEHETQSWSAATRASEHKYIQAEIERSRAEAPLGVDFSERGALQDMRREQAKACKDVVDDWEAWVDEEYGPQRP